MYTRSYARKQVNVIDQMPRTLFLGPKDPDPMPYLEYYPMAATVKQAIRDFVPNYELLNLCGCEALNIHMYWFSEQQTSPESAEKDKRLSIRFHFQDKPKNFREIGYSDVIQINHWIYDFGYEDFCEELKRMESDATSAYFSRKVSSLVDYAIKNKTIAHIANNILNSRPVNPASVHDFLLDAAYVISDYIERLINETNLGEPMNIRFIEITPFVGDTTFDVVNSPVGDVLRFSDHYGYDLKYDLTDGYHGTDNMWIEGVEDVAPYNNPENAYDLAEEIYYTRLNSFIGDVLYGIIRKQTSSYAPDEMLVGDSL